MEAVTTVKHASADDAKVAFQEQFEDAVEKGRWMGVICTVDPEGNLQVRRTTCNFPTGEFDAVVLYLNRQLTEERRSALLDDSPLPLAGNFPMAPGLQEMIEARNKRPTENNGNG